MDEQNQLVKKVRYICEGSCGGQISEQQYNSGLQTCQTQGCTHYGQTFKKVEEESDQVQQDPSTQPES